MTARNRPLGAALLLSMCLVGGAAGAARGVAPAKAAEVCPSGGQPVGSLSVGRGLFWEGEYVDTETSEGDCTYEYELQVGDGDRLRVALNVFHDYRTDRANNEGIHPDAASGRDFQLEVLDGSGNELDIFDESRIEGTTDGNGYSVELFLCFNRSEGEFCLPREFAATEFKFEDGDRGKALERSSTGLWKIRVRPAGDIRGWKFRLRAKLEKTPTPAAIEPVKEAQLPNLRAIPPFELTFCEPIVSEGFLVAREPLCGKASDGLHPTQEHSATGRGLRFSAGPENIGEGALDLRQHPGDATNTPTKRSAYQRLYSPDADGDGYAEPAECDPASFDCKAGELEFHQDHAHWHYAGFFYYELFEVADPRLALNENNLGSSTPGSKVGFCPSDDGLADWGRFFQERRYRWEMDRFDREAEPGASCLSLTNPMMGLSSGWGDFYEWQRAEQFVPFPVNTDGSPKPGFYLLRATVDPERQIRESNEKDNVGFAYFEVPPNGEPINIIERDYGTGL